MRIVPAVHTVVVRLWVPDRPGALGQVASRIGAVRGSVLAIEILETGGGRAIDELVVVLPSEDLVDLMVAEVHAVEGVSVEHVRPVAGDRVDAGLLALSLAAEVAESTGDQRRARLVAGVVELTESDWAMLVHGTDVVASVGPVPSADWIDSLLAGSRHLGNGGIAAADLFWAELPTCGMWLAAGREERPVHERERDRLHLLVRIADSLLS